jgi:serine/threonine protein kinase
MESADMDLWDYSKQVVPYEVQSSILYQILFALYAAHHYYGIYHGDIKIENIMLQKVAPGGYFKYQIKNKVYYVKNVGIIAYLADFGVCEILSKSVSTAKVPFHGSRNAFVDEDAKKWVPINIPGNPILKWNSQTDIIVGTENEIVGEAEVKMLEYMVEKMNPNYYFKRCPRMTEATMPPFEFFNDIQDVFGMFVGGDRTVQPGRHLTLIVDPEMKSLLKKIDAVVNYEQIFTSLGTLKYVLVQYMIDELYREDPQAPKKRPCGIIATFKMN